MQSRQLHHAPDGRGHAFPAAGFDRQLPAPGGGEPVVLGPPAQLRDSPFGFDPALMLEAMERRVKRALVDLQDILRDLLDAFGDRPAMQRLGLQRPEDEQVEGTRKQVGNGVSSSWCRMSTLTRAGVGCQHQDAGDVVALISVRSSTPAVQRQAAKAGKSTLRKCEPRKHEKTTHENTKSKTRRCHYRTNRPVAEKVHYVT